MNQPNGSTELLGEGTPADRMMTTGSTHYANSEAGGGDRISTASFLHALFEQLERQHAIYVVLRFDETLLRPDCELDLLVDPSSLKVVLREIRVLLQRNTDLKLAYWREYPRHAATVILAWCDAQGEFRYYFLDIRCGIRKGGVILFDGTDLRRTRTIREPAMGARCLPRNLERALLVVRNALDDRLPSERHQRILAQGDASELATTVRTLGFRSGRLGGHSGLQLLRWQALPRGLFSQLRYGIRSLIGRATRNALGMNIILHGPDGVGKSTQAALLGEYFRRIGVRNVSIYHSFVNVEAASVHVGGAGLAAKKKMYKTAGKRHALRWVIVASYAKKLLFVRLVLRTRARRGHIGIHDRYLIDVFQKALRSVGVRFRTLERILPAFSPAEAFLFVLDADATIIASRKAELDVDQVTESYAALFAALSSSPSVPTRINANQGVTEVHRDLLAAILDVQTLRTVRGAA